MYVDVHAHLEALEDVDKAMEKARNAGVKAIIYDGINPLLNRKVLEVSNKYVEVKAALGLYPIEALAMSDDEIDKELAFIEENKDRIVAIGEVGLDFKEDLDSHERQKEIFSKIIRLAMKLDKALSIHSRKAEKEVIELLESHKARKVHLHCFMGNMKLVRRAIDNGWHLSIPSNVVFSEHFQQIARIAPLQQLLTETDTPFLSPLKDGKNEPANVTYAAKKIAEIKAITEQDAANMLFMNYQNLFL